MMYGGVPIVTTAQNAILGDGSSKDELEVQRSSTADCIDFICEDLDKAIAMLPGNGTIVIGDVSLQVRQQR